jgi:virulence-associated protein VagC
MAINQIPITIDYTSRDYEALREELVARIKERIPEWNGSDNGDFGVVLAEAFAYMGDVANYYIDRIANESFLSTATQRESILAIAETYGYVPSGYKNASVDVVFYNNSSSAVTIPAETRIDGEVIANDTVETVTFTTTDSLVVPPFSNQARGEATVLAYEGKLNTVESNDVYGVLLGTSDAEPSQTFIIDDFPVVTNSVEIYVQGGTAWKKWQRVTHLIDFSANDAVFTTRLTPDNEVIVLFGDGISGAIPTYQSAIRAKYVVGGGNSGNVPSGTLINIARVPGLSQTQVSALNGVIDVNNVNAAVGGNEPEDNESIRAGAPLFLRTQNRAVTLDDFQNLALSVENCGKAKAVGTSATAVTLYVAPYRDFSDFDATPGIEIISNVPTATLEWNLLKTDVQNFLANKMLVGTTLSVVKPVYVPVTMNLQYTREPEFSQTVVEKSIKAAIVENYSYNFVDFGQELTVQNVESLLQTVEGVKFAKCRFLYKTGGTPSLAAISALPNEILTFAEPDVVLEVL